MVQKTSEPNFDSENNLFDRDAEEGLLGSIIINPEMFVAVSKFVSRDDFYIVRNKYVWDAIESLYKQKLDVDILTLTTELERMSLLQEIGGPSRLTALVSRVGNSMHAESYARVLERLSYARKISSKATQILKIGYSQNTLEVMQNEYEKEVANRPAIVDKDDTQQAEVASLELLEEISSGQPQGLLLGWPVFDHVDYGVGGLPKEGITILIGDSSFGKSAFCLQACEQVALSGKKSLYFGYEAPNREMVSRRVFGRTGINYRKLRSGTLTQQEQEILIQETQNYQAQWNGNLLFNTRARTLRGIERAIMKHRPNFVVVDQFRQIQDRDKTQNITMNFLENFAMLKWFAAEYHCSILVVHGTTPEESKAFFKNNASQSQQVNAKVPKNRMPDINNISWASDLKFLTDVMLVLVPNVSNVLAGANKSKILDILIWNMKDRQGERFTPMYWRYDLAAQWFTDVMPPSRPTQQAQVPSAVGSSSYTKPNPPPNALGNAPDELDEDEPSEEIVYEHD